MDSTRVFGVVALVVVVATAGCIGFVTGEEALVYQANAASVVDDVTQQTGYEQTFQQELVVNQTVTGREVEVHNYYARYEKYDDIAEETTGMLAVISTHRVDVLGHTTNPYADMPYDQMLANLTADYDTSFGSLGDARFVENQTATVLGEEARVGVYATNTTLDGEQVEIKLYVTRVVQGDDVVVAIGGHPTKQPAGEQEVLALLEGIQLQDGSDGGSDGGDASDGESERLAGSEDGTLALRVAA